MRKEEKARGTHTGEMLRLEGQKNNGDLRKEKRRRKKKAYAGKASSEGQKKKIGQ